MKCSNICEEERSKFLTNIVNNLPKVCKEVVKNENPEKIQDLILSRVFFSQDLKEPKIIKISGFSNGKKMLQGLNEKEIKTRIPIDFFEKISYTKEKNNIKLVFISLANLGLSTKLNKIKGIEYEEICEQAKQFGLSLCPPEIGPQLRLQYSNQPKGEWIVIATEPIIDSDDIPKLFVVGSNDSGLWLNSVRYHKKDDFFSGQRLFAFVVNQ